VLSGWLFSRWCQENFFRYMMQHFAIDLLRACPREMGSKLELNGARVKKWA
jgi:hypothetical protein